MNDNADIVNNEYIDEIDLIEEMDDLDVHSDNDDTIQNDVDNNAGNNEHDDVSNGNDNNDNIGNNKDGEEISDADFTLSKEDIFIDPLNFLSSAVITVKIPKESHSSNFCKFVLEFILLLFIFKDLLMISIIESKFFVFIKF